MVFRGPWETVEIKPQTWVSNHRTLFLTQDSFLGLLLGSTLHSSAPGKRPRLHQTSTDLVTMSTKLKLPMATSEFSMQQSLSLYQPKLCGKLKKSVSITLPSTHWMERPLTWRCRSLWRTSWRGVSGVQASKLDYHCSSTLVTPRTHFGTGSAKTLSILISIKFTLKLRHSKLKCGATRAATRCQIARKTSAGIWITRPNSFLRPNMISWSKRMCLGTIDKLTSSEPQSTNTNSRVWCTQRPRQRLPTQSYEHSLPLTTYKDRIKGRIKLLWV